MTVAIPLVISRATALLRPGTGPTLLWLVEREQGTPLPGVEVVGFDARGAWLGPRAGALGATDASGLLRIERRAAAPDGTNGPARAPSGASPRTPRWAAAWFQDELALFPLLAAAPARGPAPPARWQSQPLARAGEPLRLEVPGLPQERLVATLRGPDGVPRRLLELRPDRAAGGLELALDSSAPPGRWTLDVGSAGRTLHSLPILVGPARDERLRLNATLKLDSAGEQLSAEVRARLQGGYPLTGAAVSWRLLASPAARPWEDAANEAGASGSSASDAAAGQGGAAAGTQPLPPFAARRLPNAAPGSDRILASGTAHLDAEGRARWTLDAPHAEADAPVLLRLEAWYEDGPLRATAAAELDAPSASAQDIAPGAGQGATPGAGQDSTPPAEQDPAAPAAQMTREAPLLGLVVSRQLAAPRELIRVRAFAADRPGQPIGHLDLTLVVLDAGGAELERRALRTLPSGTVETSVTFDAPGRYRLELRSAPGPVVPPVAAVAQTVWVHTPSDRRSPDPEVPDRARLLLEPSDARGSLRALVLLPGAEHGPALWTASDGQDPQAHTLERDRARLELPAPAPGTELTVSAVRGGRLIEAGAVWTPPADPLRVSATAPPVVAPGEALTLALRTTRSDGAPRPARLVASLFSEQAARLLDRVPGAGLWHVEAFGASGGSGGSTANVADVAGQRTRGVLRTCSWPALEGPGALRGSDPDGEEPAASAGEGQPSAAPQAPAPAGERRTRPRRADLAPKPSPRVADACAALAMADPAWSNGLGVGALRLTAPAQGGRYWARVEALDADGRRGATWVPVTVRAPLSLEAAAPQHLRVGDTSELAVVIACADPAPDGVLRVSWRAEGLVLGAPRIEGTRPVLAGDPGTDTLRVHASAEARLVFPLSATAVPGEGGVPRVSIAAVVEGDRERAPGGAATLERRIDVSAPGVVEVWRATGFVPPGRSEVVDLEVPSSAAPDVNALVVALDPGPGTAALAGWAALEAQARAAGPQAPAGLRAQLSALLARAHMRAHVAARKLAPPGLQLAPAEADAAELDRALDALSEARDAQGTWGPQTCSITLLLLRLQRAGHEVPRELIEPALALLARAADVRPEAVQANDPAGGGAPGGGARGGAREVVEGDGPVSPVVRGAQRDPRLPLILALAGRPFPALAARKAEEAVYQAAAAAAAEGARPHAAARLEAASALAGALRTVEARALLLELLLAADPRPLGLAPDDLRTRLLRDLLLAREGAGWPDPEDALAAVRALLAAAIPRGPPGATEPPPEPPGTEVEVRHEGRSLLRAWSGGALERWGGVAGLTGPAVADRSRLRLRSGGPEGAFYSAAVRATVRDPRPDQGLTIARTLSPAEPPAADAPNDGAPGELPRAPKPRAPGSRLRVMIGERLLLRVVTTITDGGDAGGLLVEVPLPPGCALLRSPPGAVLRDGVLYVERSSPELTLELLAHVPGAVELPRACVRSLRDPARAATTRALKLQITPR